MASQETDHCRSSAKAKYCTMTFTTAELNWLQQLLRDFQRPISSPPLIFDDNHVAIHIASNPLFHERTKYVEIDCHFVCDNVTLGELHLLPI